MFIKTCMHLHSGFYVVLFHQKGVKCIGIISLKEGLQ